MRYPQAPGPRFESHPRWTFNSSHLTCSLIRVSVSLSPSLAWPDYCRWVEIAFKSGLKTSEYFPSWLQWTLSARSWNKSAKDGVDYAGYLDVLYNGAFPTTLDLNGWPSELYMTGTRIDLSALTSLTIFLGTHDISAVCHSLESLSASSKLKVLTVLALNWQQQLGSSYWRPFLRGLTSILDGTSLMRCSIFVSS